GWAVNACVVTPDGRHVVSASDDRTLMVWDLASMRAVATLEGHTLWVHSCAVAPDSRYVVSTSSDRTLKVWDLRTYPCRLTHRGDVAYLGVAITATVVVAGDEAGIVSVLDMPRSLTSPIDAPAALELSMTHTTSPAAAPAHAADHSPSVDIGIVTIRE